MTPAADSVNPWRATVERFQAPPAAPPGPSPWQRLMADRAERRVNDSAGGAGGAARVAPRGAPSLDGARGARDGPAPVGGIPGAIGANPWRARVERFEPPAAPEVPTFEVVPTRGDTLVADAAPKSTGIDSTATPAPAATEPPPKEKEFRLFSEDGITLADVIDVINPLQHIPIVSSLYRHLTGDEINVAPRVMGDTLFFGSIGAAFSVLNVALSAFTGKDVGEHVIAFLEKNADPEPMVIAEFDREPISRRWLKDTGAVSVAEANTPATKAADATAPATIPPALAALLPEGASRAPRAPSNEGAPFGATPVGARQVSFVQSALRPAAFAPTPVAASDPPAPVTVEPAPLPAPSSGAAAYARLLEQRQQQDAWSATKAYRRPDPTAGLVAKRTPAAVAGQLAPGATAQDGGWFSDAMLSALAKYQENAKLRADPAPASVDMVH